jgi:hypothetical protein
MSYSRLYWLSKRRGSHSVERPIPSGWQFLAFKEDLKELIIILFRNLRTGENLLTEI